MVGLHFPDSPANWLGHWEALGEVEGKKLALFSTSTFTLGGTCQAVPPPVVPVSTEQSFLLSTNNIISTLCPLATEGVQISSANLWGLHNFPLAFWPFYHLYDEQETVLLLSSCELGMIIGLFSWLDSDL